ncbi:MAG: Na/Pi cotransporter family protein [Marvinbryantia sp.]|jgi:phosphate:Na+ symporter
MDIFAVLAFLGGLAFFLYGMSLMGDGLSRASGGKMEKILEQLTSSKWKGVLLGAAVTAVIQSSSATTVMVVGFVNSGIMKLGQAVGVIMGANIGTTATSWILSLTGIEGGNVFMQLLKPSSFAPILALIGAALLLFFKSDKKKNIGTIMVGFAILMYGMDAMSGAVKPLADVPEFGNVLMMFTNPIMGVLAGTIITAVIQSSSASVGILQALCATGSVTYGLAIPIIMGQNIGTCITAILSAIGANKNAKRAAAIHLYFNLIGTAVFMVLFYGINMVVRFDFLGDAIGPANVAVIHSIFNVFTTAVLYPFSNMLVRLAKATVGKEKEGEPKELEVAALDERFLERPSFACEQAMEATRQMAELSRESFNLAVSLFDEYDEKKAQRVCELEDVVDKYEDHVGSYLVELSSRNLSDSDSRALSMMLHCLGDFERISDHSVSVMTAAQELYTKKLSFSEKGQKEMEIYTKAALEITNIAFDSFIKDDLRKAMHVEPLEEVMDSIRSQVKERHVRRLQEGRCTIEMGFILSDICTDYERVADHCSNIAVYLLQRHDNSYDQHAYADVLRHGDNEEFKKECAMYREKYILP